MYKLSVVFGLHPPYTLHPISPWSENRRRLLVIGTYLRRYSASTTTRLALSPEYSNCERQSQENTRRKFPAASLLEHIAGISMCHQHQRTRRQLLPFGNCTYAISHLTGSHPTAPPPGLHSESKIKYLRETVNTVTDVLSEVGKLEIGRVPLRWGTRCVFHDMLPLLGSGDEIVIESWSVF